jgi:ribosomal protein L37AE/L43A
MKSFLKRFFCNHNYIKISWYEKMDNVHHERYAVRVYKCEKCGKQIELDGRYDYPFLRLSKIK